MNQCKLDVELFSLEQLVEDTAHTFSTTVEKKQISLWTVIETDKVVVSGDQHRLRQIIQNIIGTPIK